MQVLVTGATGFVGRALVPMLQKSGHDVAVAVRNITSLAHLGNIRVHNVGDIGPKTGWQEALTGIDAVIHLAGRAHVITETDEDPLAAYRHINRDGTRQLTKAAADAGVKRIVYLSSVKVNGERTTEQPFDEIMTPEPENAYGVSKLEGEQALLDIATKTSLETVIVRTPLVYGPYVKGNFLSLLNICMKNLPLPLGGLKNRRNLIYVNNLADALIQCLSHANATGGLYLVSDGDSISTTTLINKTAKALEKTSLLFSLPNFMLKTIGLLTGKKTTVCRLIESLEVSDTAIRRDLGWTPPFTMVQGLAETAAWFKSSK
jgi:nucleoside-diphosphate-sugar epimerase